MKKKILIIVACVLVLILGTIGVIHLMNDRTVSKKENEDQGNVTVYENILENNIFAIQTKEQLELVCKENDLNFKDEVSEAGEAYTTIYDLQSFGEMSQFYFGFDEQLSVQSVEAYIILFGYEKDNPHQPKAFTAAELNTKIHDVLGAFCEMHGTKLEDKFYIFSDATMLDNGDDASYEQIMKGTARLEFTLRDGTGYYWSVTSQTMYDGSVFLMIEKFYDMESYQDMITNITVQY